MFSKPINFFFKNFSSMGNSDSKQKMCNKKEVFETILEESVQRMNDLSQQYIEIQDKIRKAKHHYEKAGYEQMSKLILKNHKVVCDTVELMTLALIREYEKEYKKSKSYINKCKIEDCVQVVVDPNPYF